MDSNKLSLLDYFRRCQKVLSSIALGADAKDIFAQLQAIVESMETGRIASVLRLDEATKTLHHYGINRLPKLYADAIDGVEIGECVGCCGSAVYLGRTVIVKDIQNHPNWVKYRDIAKLAHLGSCWSVPIVLSDGCVFGSFAVYSPSSVTPTEDELEVLTMSAHIGSVAIEKARLEEKLKFAATHDILTGLLNRTQFELLAEKMLANLERNQLSMSLLFLDLNNFKEVNDQYGHDLGDELLTLFARVLSSELRESDIVCRRGGDEFLVALVGTSQYGSDAYIDRVRRDFLDKQLALKFPQIIEFSVGVSEAMPDAYPSLVNLMIEADKKMYKNKELMKKGVNKIKE
jgi:diguanylate cyclase